MHSNEARFRTPDGWKPGEYANMAGDAEPARVGTSLAIADQHLRDHSEFPERGENRRRLPERQEARDVGKAKPPAGHRFLDHATARAVPDDRSRNTVPAIRGERGVKSAREFRVTPHWRFDDQLRESLLKGDGCTWRESPAVRDCPQLHQGLPSQRDGAKELRRGGGRIRSEQREGRL